MQTNFDPCLAFVLKEEGGDDDDPRDPGGRTSRGITQREYNAWCHLHGSPPADVWKAPDATVKAIYHQAYWVPYCDSLPAGLDLLYFDMAVNMGPHEATLLLQRGLGVQADGHFGLVTMSKVRQAVNMGDLLKEVSAARENYYRSLRTFRTFGKGWTNRVDACLNVAMHMIAVPS